MNEKKRLFFGAEVAAPWPSELPQGRLIAESTRHMTLAFLGQVDAEPLLKALHTFLQLPFKVGIVGKSDELLFLPERETRVVACRVKWLWNEDLLFSFQKDLMKWLRFHDYHIKEKEEFLSHVTIARAPLDKDAWKESFSDFVLKALHLYESQGNLHYVPLWTYEFEAPFEDVEHTADIAFHIRAEKMQQLHLNAQIALAFKFPSLMPYLSLNSLQERLDDIIIDLNKIILQADLEIGSPLKAVSFHGDVKKDANGILHWEMIVDV